MKQFGARVTKHQIIYNNNNLYTHMRKLLDKYSEALKISQILYIHTYMVYQVQSIFDVVVKEKYCRTLRI